MQQDLDARIRARVERFVDELTELVRQAALAAVSEALGGSRPERRAARSSGPAASSSSSSSSSARRASSATRRPRARAADVEQKKERVLAAAQRLGPRFAKKDVIAATGLDDDVTRLLALLVKEGKLEKQGERRFTTYALT